MLPPPTLSPEERAVVNQCRWIRDLPLPALGWGTVRMELYGLAILLVIAVIGINFGVSPAFDMQWAGGWTAMFILATIVAWLATLIQRMATLIDKMGRYVETQELIELAKKERP